MLVCQAAAIGGCVRKDAPCFNLLLLSPTMFEIFYKCMFNTAVKLVSPEQSDL